MTNILDAIGIGMGLSVHSFGCSSVCLSTHHIIMVSTHFQTNIPEVEYIHHGTHQIWLTFGHALLHSSHFIASNLSTWGESAAYAVVTSLIYPCGDSKDGRHRLSLVSPGVPRKYNLWCKMSETTKLKIPNFVHILPLKFHIPITFYSENYFAVCIVIWKYFWINLKLLWLSLSSHDVATDCIKPKTNATPFEVTRAQISWATPSPQLTPPTTTPLHLQTNS